VSTKVLAEKRGRKEGKI